MEEGISLGRKDLENALQAVGELLSSAGQRISIVVIGGAALHLQGVIERTTRDVDVVALTNEPGGFEQLIRPPKPLPDVLLQAVRNVALDLGLPDNWLNRGPANQWDIGLPPGFEQRVKWQSFAALDVGVADRLDLIFFKLEAAADQPDSANRHCQDLIALNPSRAELEKAAEWVRAKNVGPDYHEILDRVIKHVTDTLAGNSR
jgi:hypothetical protein